MIEIRIVISRASISEISIRVIIISHSSDYDFYSAEDFTVIRTIVML